MGEAEESALSRRIEEFAKSNSPGALSIYAVESVDLPRLFASAALGNHPTNATLARFIIDWMRMVVQSERGCGPLCINDGCPYEFTVNGEPPVAFIVALPFAKSEGIGSMNAVCPRCAERAGSFDGLLKLGLRTYRRIWPDCRVIEGGRA